jgi:hypothetical protein
MNPITGSANAIVVRDEEPSVGQLLQLVIGKLGGPGESAAGVVEAVKELVQLHQQVVERRAAGEFAVAMATFQEECPLIPKNRTAEVKKNGARVYSYQYAELPEIIKIVKPILSRLQISYKWSSQRASDTSEDMTYTCTLRHANGHTDSSSFTSGVQGKADLSDSQQAGGALTYGMRMSMIQVLGLTACAPDDTDGASAPPEKINKGQLANLQALLDEVRPDMAKFLKYMDVEKIEDILQRDLRKAMTPLEQKQKKGAA